MKKQSTIFCLCLLLSMPLRGKTSNTSFDFDQYEVATNLESETLILTGHFINSNMMDIAIIHRDTLDILHLNIYQFQSGEWKNGIKTTLDPTTLFVDVATINGKERLVTYADGQLNWFDPKINQSTPLLSIPFDFRTDSKKNIPQASITHDLNDDGQDDIIAPAVDGFWVATQLATGTFSEPIKIGPPEPFYNQSTFDDERDYGEVGINPLTTAWYLSRVHNFDYNRDGRSDLIFWNEDHFDVYAQNDDGTFSIEPISFNTDVHFDSDGTYSIVFSFHEANTFSLIFGTRKSTNYTVLHSIQDMNGDGISDMVTHSLTGRSVFKMKSRYIVHFGSADKDKIVFSKNPDTAANSHGKAGATQSGGYSHQWLKDIDGDGNTDIIRYDVKIGLTGMLNVFFGRHLTIDFETHRMVGGRFLSNPSGKKRIKANVNIYDEHGGFFPFMLLGDLTGDGLPELLVATEKNKVQIFVGQPEMNILNTDPVQMNILVPSVETGTWLSDLNRDGKQDILMHFKIKEKDRPFRLVTLITK